DEFLHLFAGSRSDRGGGLGVVEEVRCARAALSIVWSHCRQLCGRLSDRPRLLEGGEDRGDYCRARAGRTRRAQPSARGHYESQTGNRSGLRLGSERGESGETFLGPLLTLRLRGRRGSVRRQSSERRAQSCQAARIETPGFGHAVVMPFKTLNQFRIV